MRFLIALLFFSSVGSAQESSTSWFEDAKFGLFIHWGAYSAGGLEASWPIMEGGDEKLVSEYRSYARRFNPVSFDPEAWVRLTKAAGQRYIVFTAKHHDGFAMFDARNMTEYKITASPYGRDTFAMLAQAARAAGVPLGVYYSPPDLHHPGYRDTTRLPKDNWKGEPHRSEWAGYIDYMEEHIRQLLTEYGPIAVVWFDGLTDRVGDGTRYQGERFRSLIQRLQPRALINNRIGLPGDFDTPEQFIPDQVEAGRPWETCMTINDSWAHRPDDLNFKSTRTLITMLVETVSKGGNFLLNVGPDGDGKIPRPAEKRLREMGKWLKVNGEAIYSSRAGPRLKAANVRATQTAKALYLHLLEVPANGRLELDGMSARILRVSLMEGNKNLPFSQTGNRVVIDTRKVNRSILIPVLKLSH